MIFLCHRRIQYSSGAKDLFSLGEEYHPQKRIFLSQRKSNLGSRKIDSSVAEENSSVSSSSAPDELFFWVYVTI
jgi:hypothetical protein